MSVSNDAAMNNRHLQFGCFAFRTETRELSKQGSRIKLQSKPAHILEILLSRHNELVRREELVGQLWPEGVFVDFENGLNTAVNRLRTALGDTAETPIYVETVPRLGYRFICPVEESAGLPCESELLHDSEFPGKALLTGADPVLNTFDRSMVLRLALAIVLALTCQFVFFCIDLSALWRSCLIN